MAIKNFCDICKKEIKSRDNKIRVGWQNEYCIKCWKDKKYWPRIHKLEKSSRFAV